MTQLADAIGSTTGNPGPTSDVALAPENESPAVPAAATLIPSAAATSVPALLPSGHAVSGTFPAPASAAGRDVASATATVTALTALSAPAPALAPAEPLPAVAPAETAPEAAVETSAETPAETPAETVPSPAELLGLASRLAAEPGLTDRLPAAVGERTWLALPVRAGLQAWLIAWPAGTGTGWHDHGDARGAMFLVQGRLTERSTTRPADHEEGRSLDLPNEDGRLRRFAASEGRSFTARHVHEVTNEDEQTAYSVHVYYPDLTLMRRYVPSGGRLLPIGTESAGDW